MNICLQSTVLILIVMMIYGLHAAQALPLCLAPQEQIPANSEALDQYGLSVCLIWHMPQEMTNSSEYTTCENGLVVDYINYSSNMVLAVTKGDGLRNNNSIPNIRVIECNRQGCFVPECGQVNICAKGTARYGSRQTSEK